MPLANNWKFSFRAEDRNGDNFTYNSSSASNFVVQPGQWIHIVVTVADGGSADPDVITYYVNGTLDKTYNTSAGFRSTSTSPEILSPLLTEIGTSSNSLVFNGYIANLVVFNRTLTSTEVSQLYNNPNTLGNLANDPAIIYKVYFPNNNIILPQYANVPAYLDINNLRGDYNSTPRWFNVVSGNINTAISLNVNTSWLYGDSETFPLFIGGIMIVSSIFNDITRAFRKIIPEVKEAYAQVSNQSVCSLLDVVPLIAVVIVVIAGVFLFIPRGGGTGGGGGRGL
jgi:hypothetical protein